MTIQKYEGGLIAKGLRFGIIAGRFNEFISLEYNFSWQRKKEESIAPFPSYKKSCKISLRQ